MDEKLERNDAQGIFVCSFQDNRAGRSGLLNLKPAGGTDAPAVAGLETRESVLGHGGDEVVAKGLGRGEEWGVHDAADGVDTEIVGAGVAATIAIEAGHRLTAAGLQRLAKDITRGSFDGFRDRHGPLPFLPVPGSAFDSRSGA